MSERAEDIVDAVAGIVSDFGSLDWDSLCESHRDCAGTLAVLRQIQGIADRHERADSTLDRSRDGVDVETGIEWTPRLPTPGPRDLRSVVESGVTSAAFSWGPLEVRELLAAGSFGRIYRAYDPKLEREVALKLQPQETEESDRDLAEARRQARVRHPNVLCVHGADIFDGQVGLWTDLLSGQTLEDKLRREGPLSEIETALIGIDLCQGLAAVHQASLVHGDLKAANVMREEGGAIVLLDFGAGRALEPPETTSESEVEGFPETIRGTPLVMAPEVLAGDPPSPAADLYALGVLLYRLSSGDYPLHASSLDELLERHRALRAVPLRQRAPSLPEEFSAIVDRALQPRPEDRFGEASEMEAALVGFVDQAAPTGRARQGASPNNLPRQLSRFIGRSRQVAELKRLIPQHPLVSLTGTGGSGKTRLALQAASTLVVGSFDEIRFVDLSSLTQPERILPLIAEAFGLRETPRKEWIETIGSHLGDRHVLLILDNCEHLLSACATVAVDLLRICPELRMIATSREALGIPGELNYPVPPLEVVDPADNLELTRVPQVESVALFLECARTGGARIRMDGPTLACVAEICRRLDGIPLAIELAAARARTLSPSQIRDRLNDRFRLLSTGRHSSPRHQTLDALIAWSYGLLTAKERLLFRRLSVFVGGWTLEAAEAICANPELPASEVPELPASEILDLLARLVDKSLIVCDIDAATGVLRFRLLETIRAYSILRQDTVDFEPLPLRHRDYFAGLAHDATAGLRSAGEKDWLRRITAEAENLRAATERSLAADVDLERGLQLVGDLARLWFATGSWSESREYCRRMMARPGATEQTTSACFDALAGWGYIVAQQGDTEEGRELLQRALLVAQALGDKQRLAHSYGYLGNVAYAQGKLTEAMTHQRKAFGINEETGNVLGMSINLSNMGNILEGQGDLQGSSARHQESLALARELGDLRSAAYSLCRLGDVGLFLGRYEDCRRYYQESLDIRRELNDRWGIAVSLVGLGEVHRNTGNPQAAFPLLEEGAAVLREIGDRYSLGKVVAKLAHNAWSLGDHSRARQEAQESLRISLEINEQRDIASGLLLLASIVLDDGEARSAATMLGAARRVTEETEVVAAVEWADGFARIEAQLVERLGRETAHAEMARGAAMTPPEAMRGDLGPETG